MPVSQYSAKPQMYPVAAGTSTETAVTDPLQLGTGFVPDTSYVQQIVQHVVETAGPATAVYQPTATADGVTYRQLPQDTAAYHTATQSTLLLQHETNAAPTHFVLPTPAPPPMPPAFGPSLPQFVVGQPGAVRPIEVERFSAPPPPPPPGSGPYQAMPCVSGMNTASGAVSYWMTLN